MQQTTARCEEERLVGELKGMRFAFIYDSTYRHITEQYLCESIPSDRIIHLDLSVVKPNASIQRLLDGAIVSGEPPDLIVHETIAPGLPHDLTSVAIPTACLDIDTFGWTSFRLRWAQLFDYVFTWHPRYVPLYRGAGHPKVFALPHAVDVRLFDSGRNEEERCYEIGFVGKSGSRQYRRR